MMNRHEAGEGLRRCGFRYWRGGQWFFKFMENRKTVTVLAELKFHPTKDMLICAYVRCKELKDKNYVNELHYAKKVSEQLCGISVYTDGISATQWVNGLQY